MKTVVHTAILTVALAGMLAAQQAAPAPAPQNRAPVGEQGFERMGLEFGPPLGFGGRMFSPTALLDRREVLNLSADQVSRLSTLENDFKAAREKAQADAKPHREELEKLWQQPAPDVTQLRTHAQALMQVQQSVQLSAITTMAQAKAILTPEQRGRVQGWADARRHEMMRGMMFRRFGRPGGMGGMGFRRGPMPFGPRPGMGEM
jgi:Spy/CpxP family protein refolding chaperone